MKNFFEKYQTFFAISVFFAFLFYFFYAVDDAQKWKIVKTENFSATITNVSSFTQGTRNPSYFIKAKLTFDDNSSVVKQIKVSKDCLVLKMPEKRIPFNVVTYKHLDTENIQSKLVINDNYIKELVCVK